MSTSPITAEVMPAKRSEASGLSMALAAKRFTAAGKPANSNPSMTSTRPRATMNSDMTFGAAAQAAALLVGRLGRILARFARRVAEVAEEIRIGTQQHARVVGTQARLIGLHRAIEAEEIGIAPERIRVDAVAFGIAVAARLLALRRRLGDQHGDVAIGLGLDFLRALIALRPELGGLARRSVCMRRYTAWLFCSG